MRKLIFFISFVFVFSAVEKRAFAAPESNNSPLLFPLKSKKMPNLNNEIILISARYGRKVQQAQLSVDDVMLAVGCSTTSVACLQQIGNMVKAPAILIGKAFDLDDGVRIELRYFDVKTGADTGKIVKVLPLDLVKREKLLSVLIRKFFRIPDETKYSASGTTTELLITTSVPRVKIYVNGQARGTAPLRLAGIPKGQYEIRAKRLGYAEWKTTINVESGKTTTLPIVMVRANKEDLEGSSKGYFAAIKPQTWIIGGVGVISLGVGLGFAADLASTQNEFNRIQGITSYEIDEMKSLKDTGERDAIVANVLMSVGAGLIVISAILSYVDYRFAKNESIGEESAWNEFKIDDSSVKLEVGMGSLKLSF